MDLDIKDFLNLDNKRKSIIQEVEKLRNQLNTESKEVGKLKSKGEDVSDKVKELSVISDRIKELEKEKKGD